MHGPARTSHSMSESSDSEEDTPPPAEPVSHAGQHHVPSASRCAGRADPYSKSDSLPSESSCDCSRDSDLTKCTACL